MSGETTRIAAISSFVLPSQMRSSTSHWRCGQRTAHGPQLVSVGGRVAHLLDEAHGHGSGDGGLTPQCADQRACERPHVQVLWQASGRAGAQPEQAQRFGLRAGEQDHDRLRAL